MDDNLGVERLKEKRHAIVARTFHWWTSARRKLAWRAEPGEGRDPYRVWLSEVLLQQTTAQAVTPYYQAFIAKWPTVEELAAAPLEAVISAFAGLGYYSRARNLHACAKEIARRGGRFPADEAALRALPGIGAYTAAAVVAIAFDRQAAPVDGNIARILARMLALETPIADSRKTIAAAAVALCPARGAGDFAEALMDVGATLCRPREPKCAPCPLSPDCAAFRTGAPEAYPRKGASKAKPKRAGAVFFAHRADGAFLTRRRPPKGLLASTVELPGTPWTGEGPGAAWAEGAPVTARWRRLPGSVEQVFTHFALSLIVYAAPYDGQAPDPHFWTPARAVDEAGFSNVMKKAVAHAVGAVGGRPADASS